MVYTPYASKNADRTFCWAVAKRKGLLAERGHKSSGTHHWQKRVRKSLLRHDKKTITDTSPTSVPFMQGSPLALHCRRTALITFTSHIKSVLRLDEVVKKRPQKQSKSSSKNMPPYTDQFARVKFKYESSPKCTQQTNFENLILSQAQNKSSQMGTRCWSRRSCESWHLHARGTHCRPTTPSRTVTGALQKYGTAITLLNCSCTELESSPHFVWQCVLAILVRIARDKIWPNWFNKTEISPADSNRKLNIS